MSKITVEGYVNERRGRMVRVSEEYRRKDQAGNWSNDGYGDFTVWLREDDQQPEIREGAVVLVTGDLKVTKVEKDGRTYTNLNIGFARVGLVRTTQKYVSGAGGGQGAPNGSNAGDWSPAPIPSPQAGAQAPDAWSQGGPADTPF